MEDILKILKRCKLAIEVLRNLLKRLGFDLGAKRADALINDINQILQKYE